MGKEMNITRITIDPDVCGGHPCIRGLRIRVSDVLDMLASGASRADILASYPYLEDADISAALFWGSLTVWTVSTYCADAHGLMKERIKK